MSQKNNEREYSVYSLSQKARVLYTLITGHFDAHRPEVDAFISPRNYLYDFEKLWNVKLHRKEVTSINGIKYTEYRIPDKVTMKKAIELFKEKGGTLTYEEERSAMKRMNALNLDVPSIPNTQKKNGERYEN